MRKRRKGRKPVKKEKIYKLFYAVGALCFTGFFLRAGADCIQYDRINNAAPLYVFMVARAVEFFLPGLLAFFVGGRLKQIYAK